MPALIRLPLIDLADVAKHSLTEALIEAAVGVGVVVGVVVAVAVAVVVAVAVAPTFDMSDVGAESDLRIVSDIEERPMSKAVGTSPPLLDANCSAF